MQSRNTSVCLLQNPKSIVTLVETQVCVRFGLHKIINKDIVFDEAIMLKKKVKQHTSAKDVVKLMNQVIFEEKHPPTRTQTQGEE